MRTRHPIATLVAATLLMLGGDSPAATVDAGVDQSCAITAAGEVECWGDTPAGLMRTPVKVAGVTSATDVTVGRDHACVLSAIGEVHCWGNNSNGELGTGDTDDSASPRKVIGLAPADAIMAGESHTCARTATGLWCWGDSDHSQLGDPAVDGMFSPTPVRAPLGDGVVASFSTGSFHTCAIRIGPPAKLFCWGRNVSGQLGVGDTVGRTVPTEVNLPGGPTSVAAGSNHTCAWLANGLYCWGSNDFGEFGSGNNNDSLLPAPTSWSAASIQWLSAGERVTCAIDGGDNASCWGRGSDGQLGNGSVMHRNEPQPVPGLFAEISAGEDHTCARSLDDEIYCWGSNGYGQLGIGGNGSHAVQPRRIEGIAPSRVAVGQRHVCATQGDTVQCWGHNDAGQLGNGHREPVLQPGEVGFASNVVAPWIASGERHSCVIRNGRVWCWGSNSSGQLGTSVDGSSVTPVQAALPSSGYTRVSAGEAHTCAIHGATGRVWCWGSNDVGQLGHSNDGGPIPGEVPGAYGIAASIVSGRYHTCLRNVALDVYCWGGNSNGQAGNGTFENAAAPALVAGLPGNIRSLGASHFNTCAADSSGAVFCWGARAALGTNDGMVTGPSAVPVQAQLPSQLFQLTGGSGHMCAHRDASNEIWCWGDNGRGQLGDGTRSARHAPTLVQHTLGAVSLVDAGGNSTCAIDTQGLHCWGDGAYGQLADGDPLYRLIPTPVSRPGVFTDGFED